MKVLRNLPIPLAPPVPNELLAALYSYIEKFLVIKKVSAFVGCISTSLACCIFLLSCWELVAISEGHEPIPLGKLNLSIKVLLPCGNTENKYDLALSISNDARSGPPIVDESKIVESLGTFPLPVEVVIRSRSFVARELVKLGGTPELRHGFKTDHGNQILDISDLTIEDPSELEKQINLIPGVLDNGIFAYCKPNKIIIGKD